MVSQKEWLNFIRLFWLKNRILNNNAVQKKLLNLIEEYCVNQNFFDIIRSKTVKQGASNQT
jgi:hypothetical protein